MALHTIKIRAAYDIPKELNLSTIHSPKSILVDELAAKVDEEMVRFEEFSNEKGDRILVASLEVIDPNRFTVDKLPLKWKHAYTDDLYYSFKCPLCEHKSLVPTNYCSNCGERLIY